MKQLLYVISDLHLGGAPAAAGERGFQICPPATQALMAHFIDGLPGRSAGADCRLVIAGDIVDFLAEEPFEAFTADPAAAAAKLRSIFDHTQPVWEALARFVRERDGALTLLLGNHDIELSMPATRALLLERVGPGRVDFLYDNEAFTLGPVLIEHGNRFDPWNAVPHGELRRVRSQLSRRLPVRPAFPALPGSRLVVDVMNGLKKDYPFIDLLKPENAGALPVAAALGAGNVRDVWQAFGQFTRQWSTDYDEDREPLDQELIASGPAGDQALYRLAADIAAGGDATQVSAVGNWLAGARAAIDEKRRQLRRDALFKALRAQFDSHRDTFRTDVEDKTYLVPARRSAQAGFKVVVYGHTHLAKRIGLPGGATYLNSGTWADLMRVPDSVWHADEAAARTGLTRFVDDLEASRLDAWRRSVPTYVRIALDGDAVTAADVHFASDGQPVSTDTLMQRLAAG